VNPRVPGRQPLPDIIDRSLRQASAYLNARGFRIGQIQYVPDMAKDVVLAVKYRDNEVPPQTRLPQNATVDLVLGQGLGSEFVSVPRLLGLTLAEAEVVLMQAGINMGAQSLDTSLTSESDTSSALIFRQSPMAYKSIRQGGSVDLWFTIDRTKIPSDTLHLETDTLINDF
jgi:beta-lactam-binding protein with PASTA domain